MLDDWNSQLTEAGEAAGLGELGGASGVAAAPAADLFGLDHRAELARCAFLSSFFLLSPSALPHMEAHAGAPAPSRAARPAAAAFGRPPDDLGADTAVGVASAACVWQRSQ